ncbi:glucuronate isomerase [Erwinia psidii]|uniref:Uronate isomerase n=1 Tax=Erwinia psidii TaxID=69224 RepID=A0A3N6RUD4_9GAMM|nr:glucuronate isomerase [Erwinia psidii]MCX8956357.1 glucuronate isomerase [Erwinia psidii]RQM36584.1 glucuronate isomerase [Erwinia psidii]
MKPFMSEDFLLKSETARRLYHDYAAEMPVYDYHCHLSPREIAEDRQFGNLAQIWLEGDHYKWRALRCAGVPEALITGQHSSDYDKYLAWANTVPQMLGNPLYHWTHLELRRPFGISGRVFGPETAESVWHECNEKLATKAFSARGIMCQMNVRMVGTTDDPLDSLEYHRRIAADKEFPVAVTPSWRPDRVLKIAHEGFVDYIHRLEQVADVSIHRFDDLRIALTKRLDHFAEHGCLAADHGIDRPRFAPVPDDKQLDAILARRLQGEKVSELEVDEFTTALLVWLGSQYHQRGWAMQLHIGALRNTNTRMFRALGPDAGFDSMGDSSVAWPLSRLLDSMEINDRLPKTILYCINPRDNEVMATMAGNFQAAGMAGKIQFGSAWWYNDQQDGMLRQLTQLSRMGLLSHFIGMLTDSRSFLSYTRHEYFRRIFCNMLGQWVEEGEIPADWQLLRTLTENVCCRNAARYFALDC